MRLTSCPELDAERYYTEKAKALQKLPKCCDCGEAIQEEEFLIDDDAKCWHEDCYLRSHRVFMDRFLQGGY